MRGSCPWCGAPTEEWLEIDLADNERARAKCYSCDWRYTEPIKFVTIGEVMDDGLSTDS